MESTSLHKTPASDQAAAVRASVSSNPTKDTPVSDTEPTISTNPPPTETSSAQKSKETEPEGISTTSILPQYLPRTPSIGRDFTSQQDSTTNHDLEALSPPSAPFETSETRSPTSEPFSIASNSSEPPSLNYSLSGRKRWIAFFWTLIVFDSVGIPLGVYFGLWYGVGPGLCPVDHALGHVPNECPASTLSANAVFSISTACLGGVSIVEYFLRFWRLWRKGSTCRVIGARRAYLDWFHWNFSAAWFFIMVELIVGTIPNWPPIRLLAMPPSSLLYWFSFQLIVEDTLRLMDKRSPIRISSVPKGARFRPGIYSIIEDVIAVDGSGGTEFRTRLNERFEQSHYFRQMLHRLTLFWAVGSLAAAVLTTILVFTLERDAAYVVGWVLPFMWAGVWSCITIWYVKRELAHERREWGKPNALRNMGRYSLDIPRSMDASRV